MIADGGGHRPVEQLLVLGVRPSRPCTAVRSPTTNCPACTPGRFHIGHTSRGITTQSTPRGLG